MRFVNGEKFSGNFIGDKVEGEGVFYKLNNEIVGGIWHNNIFTS